LDNYVAGGSFLKVVAEFHDELPVLSQKTQQSLKNQQTEFVNGIITDRDLLDNLDIPSFDHIIVLCDKTLDIQRADAGTLVTLLHLRDIEEKTGCQHISIVSEILDIKNRELASATSADDFIVSNKIISLMLAQLSENKHLKMVFDDLFDSEGSEICLKPVEDYIETGKEITFYTLVESAAGCNEIAIGYRKVKYASDSDKVFGIVLNPDKSKKFLLEPGDKVIVIAED